ncbi:hypothetical protein CAMSH0001_0242 [Campylobacter showae RM3277]|uniref:Uncharacterized protein n=1 Tax=Campylobacter showae RM3277 TaxID=553219 RepID=C6RI90_9BACT|nr:hypothetical protein CAMSH0001_0242 [Campylobacter showae RM3277]
MHFKFVNLRSIFGFTLNFTHPDPHLENYKFANLIPTKFPKSESLR